MRAFLFAFLLLLPKAAHTQDAANHVEFVVVIPSYNNEKWCVKNLKSVFNQTYKHWSIYYVNDFSTDKTGELVDSFIQKSGFKERCTVVHNTERLNAVQNTYNAIHNIPTRKVVVMLDGDDWFAHNKVLERIAKVYADKSVWMTYGDYVQEPLKGGSCCRPFPEDVAKNLSFRSEKWIYGPVRTFYAKLFHRIKKKDLMVGGKFLKMAGDVAFMFPMLEMASKGHIRYIKDILYIYNVSNPINDHRINAGLQVFLERKIRAKPKYEPLDALFSGQEALLKAQ